MNTSCESIFIIHIVTDEDVSLKIKQIGEFNDSKVYPGIGQAIAATRVSRSLNVTGYERVPSECTMKQIRDYHTYSPVKLLQPNAPLPAKAMERRLYVGIGHSPPMECRAQCRQSIAGRESGVAGPTRMSIKQLATAASKYRGPNSDTLQLTNMSDSTSRIRNMRYCILISVDTPPPSFRLDKCCSRLESG
jgi:hypothetical protein